MSIAHLTLVAKPPVDDDLDVEIEPDMPFTIGRTLVVVALDERLGFTDHASTPATGAYEIEFCLNDRDLEDVYIDVDCDPALIIADEPLRIAA